MIFSASNSDCAASLELRARCADPAKLATPLSTSMPLRDSCARVTSIFGLDHVLHTEGQIRHGDLFLHAVVDAINVLVLETRKVQHCFAHGLAGNGAGVDARASNHFHFFHQRDLLTGLRRLDRGALPGRSGTNHDDVEAIHVVPDAKGAASVLNRPRKYTPAAK